MENSSNLKNIKGNSPIIDEKKETIIWLDKNVFNKENQFIYEAYFPRLNKYNFICFTTIKTSLEFIKINLKYFEFRLFYIIVSGRLAEEFYKEYVKITEKYNIIASITVYCMNQKYHETKPYFKDKFLNAGGITFDFEYILNYLEKDECGWENILQNYKAYIPAKESFGDVFMYMDPNKEYELALPILIGKLINSSLIEKGEISKFQNLLLSRYCKAYSKKDLFLIKPSGNKNMNIPLHILTKLFLKFYTLDGPFHKNINLDLSNDKFDDYYPFIFLLYDSLNKGFIKSYKSLLFRGGKLSKKEFDNIISHQKSNNNEKLFYFSKNFLSFSKDIEVALNPNFFNNQDNIVTVLYILEEPKNKDFYVTNLDIETLSDFSKEKEVLILPLTCFEIVKITDEVTYNDVKYRIIYLNYLDKYAKIIYSKIDDLKKKQNQNEINKFFNDSIQSKYGQKVQKYYDKQNKISISYCKIVGSSADNNYFMNQIVASFTSIAMHVDDEFPNLVNNKFWCCCKISENNDETNILNFFEKFCK